MSVNKELLKTKMQEYVAEYEAYAAYASFLKAVLTSACSRMAPFAIVEARPKSKASYAEKVTRKQVKFNDPAYQITDRCGARVITQTSQEKALVCDYIRRNFDVDEKNSLDVRSRLKEDEFGYLSVHYVVQIKKTDKSLEGISVPQNVTTGPSGLKAEIQVRTLLEHVWANTLHDRMYKVAIDMPSALKRDAAALAATMEESDKRFSRLSHAIDAYLGNYSAYLTSDKMAKEVEILRSARQYESNPAGKAAATLRLARLARTAGDLEQAIAELETCVNEATPSQNAIRMELGHALCLRHRKNTKSAKFTRGQRLLREVVDRQLDERDTVLPSDQIIRAEAARLLAWSFTEMKGKECEARDSYRQALELDPNDPYHLAAFLEYEAFCRRDHSFIRVMRQPVEQAIATCRSHVAVGIEIPRAYFTMARLYLLIEEHTAAFNAYTKAIRVTLEPNSSVPDMVIDDEIAFLQRVNFGTSLPAEHEIAERLLKLARALKKAKPDQAISLQGLAVNGVESIRKSRKKTALIIVGGAAKMTSDETQQYAAITETALESYDGLVFCGGTKTGIPGLVGKTAAELKRKGKKRFLLMSYVSTQLPKDAPLDNRYDKLIDTNGVTLTRLEPLQNWIDLIQAGIRPGMVRVLGINGGTIAGFEYRLALALGAKVGIVLYSGREANALLHDEDWARDSNLVRLPREVLDSSTLPAFVWPGDTRLTPDQLDQLGKLAHEDYLQQNQYSEVDPVRKPWGKLREDFRESNRQQIAYAAEILHTEGYIMEKAKGKIHLPVFKSDKVERMAEREHGRWIIERLSTGWTYGPKDAERKISPYICPWKDIPDNIKEYDRDAIRNYARILAEAGYAVVKFN